MCVCVCLHACVCVCVCVYAYVCMCVQALSMKETALRDVTEQWQISQQVLAEREKELSQVSGQHSFLSSWILQRVQIG